MQPAKVEMIQDKLYIITKYQITRIVSLSLSLGKLKHTHTHAIIILIILTIAIIGLI